ncbi:hypothetical protein Ancab_017426 [Ancistrocladus abbreviatus]
MLDEEIQGIYESFGLICECEQVKDLHGWGEFKAEDQILQITGFPRGPVALSCFGMVWLEIVVVTWWHGGQFANHYVKGV